jgi:hypothetical protein
MNAKTSTRVTGWQKLGRFLVTALTGSQGVRVAQKMFNRIVDSIPEGLVIDFLATLKGLSINLDEGLGRLVRLDEALFKANATLDAKRVLREKLHHHLATLISALRDAIVRHYLDARIDQLGLENRTANSIGHLLRQVFRICITFVRDDLDEMLGEAKFGTRFDPRPNVLELKPIADELDGVIEQIDDAIRVRDQFKVERDRVLAEVYNSTIYTAQTFECHCRLAGERELADRVRPSTHVSTSVNDTATPAEVPAVTPPQADENVGDAVIDGRSDS